MQLCGAEQVLAASEPPADLHQALERYDQAYKGELHVRMWAQQWQAPLTAQGANVTSSRCACSFAVAKARTVTVGARNCMMLMLCINKAGMGMLCLVLQFPAMDALTFSSGVGHNSVGTIHNAALRFQFKMAHVAGPSGTPETCSEAAT